MNAGGARRVAAPPYLLDTHIWFWYAVASDRLSGSLRAELPLLEASLTREVTLVCDELVLPHRDPADRLLAATALVHGLTLVTIDRRLRDASWLPTRSG